MSNFTEDFELSSLLILAIVLIPFIIYVLVKLIKECKNSKSITLILALILFFVATLIRVTTSLIFGFKYIFNEPIEPIP